ncbi:MAG TPA: hypothetical protein VEQ10_04975 [Vicinamibacteria bacterium]|nr:hypothetical protein [Vicinamibacteria bacterium]
MLDDPAEKVQVFCELLRTTNPVLESGATDLERLAHGLSDAEEKLSMDLDSLATEVDGLQKEAQSSGNAAAKACQELNLSAEQTKTTALAALENGAAGFESRWTHELEEKAGALAAAFQEIKGSGWEPLMAALASEHGDFERWTQASEEGLTGMIHQFTDLASAVEHQAADATQAAHDLTAAPLFDRAFWNDPDSAAEKLMQETIPWFRNAEREAAKELSSTRDELVAAVGSDSSHVRGQLELDTRQLAAAVDAQAGELVQTLQQTVQALSQLQLEFERGAVQADRAQPDARKLADLAGQVPQAEALLQRIRAASEAMAE